MSSDYHDRVSGHRRALALAAAAALAVGWATPARGQMTSDDASRRLMARAAARRAVEVEKRRPLLNQLKAKAAAGDFAAVWSFAVQKQLVAMVKGETQIEADDEFAAVKRSYLAWVDSRGGAAARGEGLSTAAAANGSDTVGLVLGAEAARRFAQAADVGHRPSQLCLAEMCLRGWGIPKDDARGLRLLTAAATAGYPPAEDILARAELNGWNGLDKDPVAAVAWATRAARAGDLPSRALLGAIYSDGVVVPRDMDLAMDWLYKAATGGDLDAVGLLTVIVATGDHWPADPAEGFRWATVGADAGDARCLFLQGLMYEHGSGTRQNLASAQKSYQAAADAGEADGRAAVARVSQLRAAIAARRARDDADRQQQLAGTDAGSGGRRTLDLGHAGPSSPYPNWRGNWATCPACGGTGFDAAAQQANGNTAGALASANGPVGITVARHALVYCGTCGGTGRVPMQ